MKNGDRVTHKDRPKPAGTVSLTCEIPETDAAARARFPSGVCVNVLWDESVADPKAGTGRVLSHDSEELVPA